jgi:hypothetical protein
MLPTLVKPYDAIAAKSTAILDKMVRSLICFVVQDDAHLLAEQLS